MKLTVLSLNGVEFDGEAKAFTAKTTTGEITVLDHHRPLVTILAEGLAKIRQASGEVKELAIRSGFLEVSLNTVMVLID